MSAATIRLRLQYFASLREKRGVSREELVTPATTPAEVYDELAEKHGFTLPAARLRVAVNGEFADLASLLHDGDEVVFIPPVAGG